MDIKPVAFNPIPVEPSSESSEEKRRREHGGTRSGQKKKSGKSATFHADNSPHDPVRQTSDLTRQIVDSGKVVELLSHRPQPSVPPNCVFRTPQRQPSKNDHSPTNKLNKKL